MRCKSVTPLMLAPVDLTWLNTSYKMLDGTKSFFPAYCEFFHISHIGTAALQPSSQAIKALISTNLGQLRRPKCLAEPPQNPFG
jgi:hypothetical protein